MRRAINTIQNNTVCDMWFITEAANKTFDTYCSAKLQNNQVMVTKDFLMVTKEVS